jgi:hypothetical protein
LVERVQCIEPNSHEPVQSFEPEIELLESLSSRAIKILKVLGADGTASEAAKMVPCSKSLVNYWKNKLINMGALRLQTDGIVKYYGLTPFGSKILTGSEHRDDDVEVVLLEDHAVKFEVFKRESVRLDWERLGAPRNWVKLGVRLGDCRVVKTSHSVIIHPGKLRGFDVDELEVDAGRVVERVKAILEGKFGMVLSDVGVPLHKPVYRFYSEEAREDVRHGTVTVAGPNGVQSSVDCSPPEHVPHEEYHGKERARARQLLPDSVRRLESKVDLLNETNGRVLAVLDRLLGKLCDAENSQDARSTAEGQKRLGEYVT